MTQIAVDDTEIFDINAVVVLHTGFSEQTVRKKFVVRINVIHDNVGVAGVGSRENDQFEHL